MLHPVNRQKTTLFATSSSYIVSVCTKKENLDFSVKAISHLKLDECRSSGCVQIIIYWTVNPSRALSSPAQETLAAE